MSSENRQWDAGRFVQTLSYFEVVPVLNWLQQWFTGANDQPISRSEGDMRVILVAGATGGVGKRVVQRLLEHHYSVRALVRDAQKGRELLGDRVELLKQTSRSQRR